MSSTLNNSRSRGWVFTLNNYTEDDVCSLSKGGPTPNEVVYLSFGREKGKVEGTPHLQGYVYFKSLKSFKQTKQFVSDRAYICQQKGTFDQAIEYTFKDGIIVEYGDRPHQGKRTDLELVAKGIVDGASISEIAYAYPSTFIKYSRGIRDLKLETSSRYQREQVCGLWLVGEPGSGKSHYAQTNFPDAYRKSQNKWFDGYAGEKQIILEDLDVGVLSHHLKIWSDKWSCLGETKGGTVHLVHDLFVVTSNYSIAELVPEKGDNPDEAMIGALERRFKVRTFKKLFIPPDVGQSGAGKWVSHMTDCDGTEHDLGDLEM